MTWRQAAVRFSTLEEPIPLMLTALEKRPSTETSKKRIRKKKEKRMTSLIQTIHSMG